MTTHLTSHSKKVLHGNYVLLTADTLHLLVPQYDVGEAEYLEGTQEAGDEYGLLKFQGTKNTRRYAALSAQMTMLPNNPPDRFLATTIGEDNMDISWSWNELRILINVEFKLMTIPKILLTPNSPVDQYVEFDNRLAYLCSAKQLSKFAFEQRIG
jgi:hypothetical protein